MAYEHRQTSLVALVIVDAVFSVVILVLIFGGAPIGAIVVSAIAFVAIGALVFGFSRLTVSVDTAGGGAVSAQFAWGWPRRTIDLAEIVAIRQVRNHWIYGWGIRKVPKGWMYNVGGFDAIELERTTGKVFRIGTDEAAALLAALSQASGGRLTG